MDQGLTGTIRVGERTHRRNVPGCVSLVPKSEKSAYVSAAVLFDATRTVIQIGCCSGQLPLRQRDCTLCHENTAQEVSSVDRDELHDGVC